MFEPSPLLLNPSFLFLSEGELTSELDDDDDEDDGELFSGSEGYEFKLVVVEKRRALSLAR